MALVMANQRQKMDKKRGWRGMGGCDGFCWLW